MKSTKLPTAIITIIAACAALVWFSTSTHGKTTYEVHPEITTPEYRTDAARAIDAYERLMERFMDLNAKNITGLDSSIQQLNTKIDSINTKFTILLDRIARIEKALGIQTPKGEIPKKTCPEKQKANDKPQPKSAP